MNTNYFIIRDYENKSVFGRIENKANLLAFGVLCSADSVKMRKRYLKKQSQFTPKGVVRKPEVRYLSSAQIMNGINHVFNFAETAISGILSNRDNREKPLIALLPKKIRAGGKRK